MLFIPVAKRSREKVGGILWWGVFGRDGAGSGLGGDIVRFYPPSFVLTTPECVHVASCGASISST